MGDCFQMSSMLCAARVAAFVCRTDAGRYATIDELSRLGVVLAQSAYSARIGKQTATLAQRYQLRLERTVCPITGLVLMALEPLSATADIKGCTRRLVIGPGVD